MSITRKEVKEICQRAKKGEKITKILKSKNIGSSSFYYYKDKYEKENLSLTKPKKKEKVEIEIDLESLERSVINNRKAVERPIVDIISTPKEVEYTVEFKIRGKNYDDVISSVTCDDENTIIVKFRKPHNKNNYSKQLLKHASL